MLNSNWTKVCQLNDIAPNTGVCALFNDAQVAIFRIGATEQLYAIDNYDPCGEANVLSRGIIGDHKGEWVVASPLYKQQFKLTDGQCIEDDQIQLSTYPVTAVEGEIFLGLAQ